MARIVLDRFPRIVLSKEEEALCLKGATLSDTARTREVMVQAIALADQTLSPAHIQTSSEYTVHIVQPERQ